MLKEWLKKLIVQSTTTPESVSGPEQESERTQPAPSIKLPRNIIAIASAKGGVGKSTVTFHLAKSLVKKGYKIGVLDADLYGSSQPILMNIPKEKRKIEQRDGKWIPFVQEGVKVLSMGLMVGDESAIMWRAPMAMKALSQMIQLADWGDIDFLLIDLPPGTGDVQLSIGQQLGLSAAILVTTPQELAVGITQKGIKLFDTLRIPVVGVIENMAHIVCSQCHHLEYPFGNGSAVSQFIKSHHLEFLGALPITAEEKLADSIQPITDHFLAAMSKLLSANVKEVDLPQSVNLLGKDKLQIIWGDKTQSEYSASFLRKNCACASCVDEVTGKKILNAESISDALEIAAVEPVGRYALGLTFSDGHRTGIYSFKRLKTLVNLTENKGETSAQHSNQQTEIKSSKIENIQQSIASLQEYLNQKVNPALAGHGGKAEVVKIESGNVYLTLGGGCQGCGSATATLKYGIEKQLKLEIPWVKKVIDITDHSKGENPYYPQQSV